MIRRLNEAIEKTGAPVVVGLDPQLEFVPPHIMDPVNMELGESLQSAGEAVFRFNKEIITYTCDLVPAVKLQSAMYEQFGVPGVEAYKRTIDFAHEKGLIVIADVKRGDIGSTSKAYASAHLGKTKVGNFYREVFDAEFATVNPYLGSDGIQPFLDVCKNYDRGIFVLVKTSNPSSSEFQDLITDGVPLYMKVAEKVAQWGKDLMDGDYSNVGAVVGATQGQVAEAIRKALPKAVFLVPGYGAQGASGKDLKPFFNADGTGAVVNSSRGIISAWKQEAYQIFGKEAVGPAARCAVLDMIEDIHKGLEEG